MTPKTVPQAPDGRPARVRFVSVQTINILRGPAGWAANIVAEGYQIATPRLVVRPFVREDITNAYLSWLNDKELMRYSRQRLQDHTRESCEEYLESFARTPNFFWNASRRVDDVQVGTATAYVDSESSEANVGLLIGYPGLGYGREVLGAAMSYLFEVRGLRRVVVGTLVENQAMIRLALRCGMEAYEVEGGFWRFGILRPMWFASQDRGIS